MRRIAIVAGALLVAACSAPAVPDKATATRALTEAELATAIAALLEMPNAPLSEDPSCRSDLSKPGTMSIAAGLGLAVSRAASDALPIRVVVDCVERPGFPLRPGEEVCRLNFADPGDPQAYGYGLVFVMDWRDASVRTDSVECF